MKKVNAWQEEIQEGTSKFNGKPFKATLYVVQEENPFKPGERGYKESDIHFSSWITDGAETFKLGCGVTPSIELVFENEIPIAKEMFLHRFKDYKK